MAKMSPLITPHFHVVSRIENGSNPVGFVELGTF
jgi:hypothetical protein